MKHVYVAGPMSKGPLIDHVRHALAAADRIIAAGGAPYLPQLSVFHELVSPHEYETWLELDFAWIERCDALLRLAGESMGADREVKHARSIGKQVFLDVAALLAWLEEAA